VKNGTWPGIVCADLPRINGADPTPATQGPSNAALPYEWQRTLRPRVTPRIGGLFVQCRTNSLRPVVTQLTLVYVISATQGLSAGFGYPQIANTRVHASQPGSLLVPRFVG